MKLLGIALAFVGAAALACPADDVKDQASQGKAAVEAKAPVRAPTTSAKAVASKKATASTTKVADKVAEPTAKSSL